MNLSHFLLLMTACRPLGLGLSADLGGGAVEESAVKAALLFNFARFTDWASHVLADSTEKLLLCVLGGEAPGGAFLKTEDKPVGTRWSGIIHLAKEARKFRFQVNLGMAQHAGLKISSRFLKLMIVVN